MLELPGQGQTVRVQSVSSIAGIEEANGAEQCPPCSVSPLPPRVPLRYEDILCTLSLDDNKSIYRDEWHPMHDKGSKKGIVCQVYSL